MTVNKTKKTQKTAKTGEALTTVGIRLSSEEIKAINDQAAKTGRSKSDVLRTIIKAGMMEMEIAEGMDIVALDYEIVFKFMRPNSTDTLGDELERLMLMEINRKESAKRLAEHRKKIAEFVIEEVGE